MKSEPFALHRLLGLVVLSKIGDNDPITTINDWKYMSAVHLLDEELSPKRFVRARTFALVAMLIIAMLGVSFTQISPSDSKQSIAAKLARTTDSFWGDPALASNPGVVNTKCPTRFKVIFLVDRSSSISSAEARQLKDTLKSDMWVLANRGQTLGVAIDVYISVFASSTDNKTPFNWAGEPDVTTPKGLADHLNLIESIPFWKESVAAQSDYRPVANGVSHATNWHDALSDSAQTIGFWTSHRTAPALSADEDFDLVVMVTDGQPTVNNGPNGVYDGGAGDDQTSGGNTGNDDLKSARYVVNALRTGTGIVNWITWTPIYINRSPFPALDLSARQKVNVVGIIIDTNNNKSAMANNMNYVFGAEGSGWFYSNSFSNSLGTALVSSISVLNCTVAKTPVTPHITLSVSASPSTVKEGGTSTITYVVKNDGEVNLTGVKVIGPGGAVTNLGTLNRGDTKTVSSYVLNVAFGGAAPQIASFTATGTAVIDTTTQELASGQTLTPSATDTVAISVTRIPLPT